MKTIRLKYRHEVRIGIPLIIALYGAYLIYLGIDGEVIQAQQDFRPRAILAQHLSPLTRRYIGFFGGLFFFVPMMSIALMAFDFRPRFVLRADGSGLVLQKTKFFGWGQMAKFENYRGEIFVRDNIIYFDPPLPTEGRYTVESIHGGKAIFRNFKKVSQQLEGWSPLDAL